MCTPACIKRKGERACVSTCESSCKGLFGFERINPQSLSITINEGSQVDSAFLLTKAHKHASICPDTHTPSAAYQAQVRGATACGHPLASSRRPCQSYRAPALHKRVVAFMRVKRDRSPCAGPVDTST
jgi:hypothetical protein